MPKLERVSNVRCRLVLTPLHWTLIQCDKPALARALSLILEHPVAEIHVTSKEVVVDFLPPLDCTIAHVSEMGAKLQVALSELGDELAKGYDPPSPRAG